MTTAACCRPPARAEAPVPSGVTDIASCVQAVELCRMLAELEGVHDALPSSRLRSAASSPSIQVNKPPKP